jgi:hypothetical protein
MFWPQNFYGLAKNENEKRFGRTFFFLNCHIKELDNGSLCAIPFLKLMMVIAAATCDMKVWTKNGCDVIASYVGEMALYQLLYKLSSTH